jgi:flagellar hook-associated protein 2
MGTVGLSFGSPTSGTGFNVSSTVSEIVGNLQNVETPWKTQLTSLESQDTAISSLGTLFSNLSNDMSSLTDFNGIMAEKTGSSSNTNVLELTAASSSATAGTHTVVVNSLAATSSGYLAEVSDSSAALSGSFTLQAGNGTPETFAIGAGTSSDGVTYTGSGADTLSDLATAINSSGVGITANVEGDSSGAWLSLTSGTSGAAGNITVSNNSIAGTGQILGFSGTAGMDASGSSGATKSSGTVAGIASTDDLQGTITIRAGNATPILVTMGEVETATGGSTVGDIATYLQNNDSSVVNAASVTNSDGTVSLSLTSQTAGSAGTLAVNSNLVYTGSSTLGYTPAVTGVDANLTIDGKSNIHSSSNTVANLIPGLTFQLLSASSSPVQVVIGNDNSGVESTMAQMVSDYNALISGINVQQGNTSSGTPEPLFGSPTLSLLQQQLLSGLNMANPNGYLTAVSADANTTLSGSMTIQVGDGTAVNVVVGAGTNTANTIYTGSGSDYNTISGLAAAINAAGAGTMLSYTGTAGSGTTASAGTLTPVTSANTSLAGSISIQVGNGTTENVVIGAAPTSPAADTIYTGSGVNTLSGLASAITSAGIGVSAAVTTAADGVATLALTSGTPGSAGTLTVNPSIFASGFGVTANVVTSNRQSTLELASQTEGSSGGGLTVTSGITAISDTPLSSSVTAGSSSTASSATLTTIANANDLLSGSISIQVGTNAAQSISVPASPRNTLAGLADAINTAAIGASASVVTNSGGSYLSLTSGTTGNAGNLTVTSNILDTTATSNATLSYTNSSDINSLTTLGISVNNDGSLTFNADSLDSVLNSDFSSVSGFFQNANSWGLSFNTMLTNAGTSSATGVLSLASKSNSNIESTLNADISKEGSLISAQQSSLTAELNSANEIMQELPTQLQGVNELYSAISGYNPGSNG